MTLMVVLVGIMIERLDLSGHKPLEQELIYRAFINCTEHTPFLKAQSKVKFKREEDIFYFDFSSVDSLTHKDFLARCNNRFVDDLFKYEKKQRERVQKSFLVFEQKFTNGNVTTDVVEELINAVTFYSGMPITNLLPPQKAMEILEEIAKKEGHEAGRGAEIFRDTCTTHNGHTFWDEVYLGLVKLAEAKLENRNKATFDYFIKNRGYLMRYGLEPCSYEKPEFAELQVENLMRSNPCIDIKEERHKLKLMALGLLANCSRAFKILGSDVLATQILRYNILRADYDDLNRRNRARAHRNLAEMMKFLKIPLDAGYCDIKRRLN